MAEIFAILFALVKSAANTGFPGRVLCSRKYFANTSEFCYKVGKIEDVLPQRRIGKETFLNRLRVHYMFQHVQHVLCFVMLHCSPMPLLFHVFVSLGSRTGAGGAGGAAGTVGGTAGGGAKSLRWCRRALRSLRLGRALRISSSVTSKPCAFRNSFTHDSQKPKETMFKIS